MNQYDIRTVDRDDPNTPPAEIKAMGKNISNADDKFETFVVTHEPINLKTKLAIKKRTLNAAQQAADENSEAAKEPGDGGTDH